ncbi:glycoside hydrolase family 16 protein [Donghicola mangrovi]|uniref:Family 16 glycosylhydrolase n=1 Tax=Donghicola mangrovi TaxID=2729614 RepID=A0A850Q7N5_9RHOB|nr:family 16 glycosylhydrolase [Donghicola mangrovi]NVO23008.1 family 16 glycosylhydrolase [Donghicola mangrovi]
MSIFRTPKFLALLFCGLSHNATMACAAPDLEGLIPILHETFDEPLQRYDGVSGVWSTIPRSRKLYTNSEETVFFDFGLFGNSCDRSLADLHEVSNGVLLLRSSRVSPECRQAIDQYLIQSGQGEIAPKIKYVTSQITTSETWSQTYGYFEIVARIPTGKGRWPAFWLTHAGPGWPPEIDIFEAYGKGLSIQTPKDGTFNVAVFFDKFDRLGRPVNSVDIQNEYSGSSPKLPIAKNKFGKTVFNFHNLVRADANFGTDIYEDFHTYSVFWEENSISFYFGSDRHNLVEVFRTPTPDDLRAPMYAIANDQFTARGGGWSPPNVDIQNILNPLNSFEISEITFYAIPPSLHIHMQDGQNPYNFGDSKIFDTPADDVIAPGDGFDLIELTDGNDKILVTKGFGNKIISGFGAGDVLHLEGFRFATSAAIFRSLTQVGGDVWLPTGADPFDPQTIVFRNALLSDFSYSQFVPLWPVAPRFFRNLAGSIPNYTAQALDEMEAKLLLPGMQFRDNGLASHFVGTERSDSFSVANSKTVIQEFHSGDIDEVFVSVDFKIPENIERGIAEREGVSLFANDDGNRLETVSDGTTLIGGNGDDLFVVSEGVKRVDIVLSYGSGLDVIRGLTPGVRILIPEGLKNFLKFSMVQNGIMLHLSDSDSLLLESVFNPDILGISFY